MKETIPRQRTETVRQEIIRLLKWRRLPAGAISKEIGTPAKDVISHLDQIGRSGLLTIIPAECGACGFVFKDRNKAAKPGKCPRCRSTRINQPLFTVKADKTRDENQ